MSIVYQVLTGFTPIPKVFAKYADALMLMAVEMERLHPGTTSLEYNGRDRWVQLPSNRDSTVEMWEFQENSVHKMYADRKLTAPIAGDIIQIVKVELV